MANNYCESSSFIEIPKEKLHEARSIVNQIIEQFEEDEDEGYFGASVKVEDTGIWICHDESINVDHVETLVSALVNKLDLLPVVVSWCYSCSKPRIDEFGGGAFCVVKGKPTVWIDAASEAQKVADAVVPHKNWEDIRYQCEKANREWAERKLAKALDALIRAEDVLADITAEDDLPSPQWLRDVIAELKAPNGTN